MKSVIAQSGLTITQPPFALANMGSKSNSLQHGANSKEQSSFELVSNLQSIVSGDCAKDSIPPG